ncbi:hypothetical protein [Paracoccus sp. IB05]|uniref:hypothetical protein n=1 Tax=Paracoccus sp. IB05 TaxID=2779367 RepID=UPI0018E8AA20|nr:hypothetical protein [Paracoccus sp. IB05]MBJ2152587.1 hypothetical protein [Paracoccus sp. IB05]
MLPGPHLVDASPFVPNDFSATWHEHYVPGTTVSGDPRFEIWAQDRLEERIGDAWIDKLDIDVVGECAEMIGVSLLFCKN